MSRPSAPMRASSSTAWTSRRSTGSTACRRPSPSTRPTRCAARARTVGTMTELNDHLKLLFARAAAAVRPQTAQPVRHDSPETIYAELMARTRGRRPAPGGHLPGRAAGQHQRRRGRAVAVGQRLHARAGRARSRLADRAAQGARRGGRPLPPRRAPRRSRVIEAIETALKRGSGRVNVYALRRRRRRAASCGASRPACTAPTATCATPTRSRRCSASTRPRRLRDLPRLRPRDRRRLRPGDSRRRKTLRAGAIKTDADAGLEGEPGRPDASHAGEAGIPRDTPWSQLTRGQRDWVIDGSPNWNGKWNKQWYGIKRFFEYLESKAYKMHIRVLLSKYRSYTPCPACGGARLKPKRCCGASARKADADAVLAPAQALPAGRAWRGRARSSKRCRACALHDLMLLPIDRLRRFFDQPVACRARCSTTR